MHALDWIGYIVEWIGNFIPRILHVRRTHQGVIFTRSKAKKIGPGIHIYLPLWSQVEIYPVKRQTLNLPSQILTTKDRQSILIDVAVIYNIVDIYRALVDTYELQDTIRDICQAAVKKCISQYSFDCIIDEQEEIDEEIFSEISSQVLDYGIGIENAFITDIAKSKVLKLVTSRGTLE
jgi:regulator of protease activity HflC (stomatin/prohibitin superfamily)